MLQAKTTRKMCTWCHPICEGLDQHGLAAVENHNLFCICKKCKSFLKDFEEVVRIEKRGSLNENIGLEESAGKEKRLRELSETEENVAKALIVQKEIMMEIGKMIKAQEAKSDENLKTVVKALQEESVSYADIVKQLTDKLEKDNTSKPTEQVKELRSTFVDCLEQDKRRRNIEVFNVPEQSIELPLYEQASKELDSVKEIMKQGFKLIIHPEKVV